MSTTTTSVTEERAITLLGQGLDSKVVASALGVTESRISQLLSQEEFASKVAIKRYENLANHSIRDNKYDEIEDDVLARLKSSLSMIFDPMKLVKLLQVVNMAKRRGAGTPDAILQKQPTVSLNIPTLLIQNFSTQNNIHNQVIQIIDEHGNQDQSLVTIQSKALEALRGRNGNVLQQLNSPAIGSS